MDNSELAGKEFQSAFLSAVQAPDPNVPDCRVSNLDFFHFGTHHRDLRPCSDGVMPRGVDSLSTVEPRPRDPLEGKDDILDLVAASNPQFPAPDPPSSQCFSLL